MRNAIRSFLKTEDKKEAEERLPKIVSMVDRMAKRNIIHKNKAGNLKSQLEKHYRALA
jgi:small subunit ribosomal protein S20